LQTGDSQSRAILASYCVQDSFLPFKLIHLDIPNRPGRGDFIQYYLDKSKSGGNLVRYLANKSMDYEEFAKRLRVVSKLRNDHLLNRINLRQ